MIQLTLTEAAAILGVEPPSVPGEFRGISIDTRTNVQGSLASIQTGNLFVALAGSHVDGHDFIEDAKQKGAAALLVKHPVHSDLPQLIVPDTTLALGKLGAAWRNRFTIPFIAVTGSTGKTTLKNMIAAILAAACQGEANCVLATLGTLNNHLGLPLTLARLDKKHRYAVIEMGMNHFGEIEYLTKLTRPHVAVITNAAAAHLEGVKDLAGVARAKGEIFLGLQEKGSAILNKDDTFFTYWQERIGQHPCLTFGFHFSADITASIREKNTLKQSITLHTPLGNINIELPMLGKHNILNAMAAAAATIALGVDLPTIKTGLETMQPAPGRLQVHTLGNDIHVIDDTYNANPFSLQAAIETLNSFAGKKVLVLGDMKELGQEAETIHRQAGECISTAGIDYLFTFGELTAYTAQAFGEGAHHFTEQVKLVDALKPLLENHTTILVKGSRSMRMEKIVAGLVN